MMDRLHTRTSRARHLAQRAQSRRERSQQGAATLIVVMVLFFIISMVAAYTNRNLIFEQRTASNQYRTTQALEAADAGIEWTLAQLNAGRIADSCAASTSTADLSFRERYLTTSAIDDSVTPVAPSGGGSVNPACVLDSSVSDRAAWKWACTCPSPTASGGGLPTSSSTGPVPAFMLRMRTVGARPDLVELQSASCTRADPTCLNFASQNTGSGDASALVRVLLTLRSALTRLPAAALTVAGNLQSSGSALRITNTDIAANGITLHTRSSTLPVGLTSNALTGLGGVPWQFTAVLGDTALLPGDAAALSPVRTSKERRFSNYFGMWPDTYRNQPGLPVLDGTSGCNSTAINQRAALNPGRPLWIEGCTTVSINTDIGSAAEPVLLIVVDGDLNIASGVTVNGLIYGRKPEWVWNASNFTINGAVIAEGRASYAGGADPASLDIVGTGPFTMNYDAAILKTLRFKYGTFVRVPNSWKDFSP